MFCTQCNSDNIQKLSLVYEMGVVHTTSKSRGSGVGFGPGGIGVGFGGGTTNGVHVSAAAQRAAPPFRRNVVGPIVVAIIAFLMANSHFFAPLMWLVMLISSGLAVVRFLWNTNVFPGLADRWMRSYQCNRCGAMMIPTMAQPARVSPSPNAGVETIQAPSLPESQI